MPWCSMARCIFISIASSDSDFCTKSKAPERIASVSFLSLASGRPYISAESAHVKVNYGSLEEVLNNSIYERALPDRPHLLAPVDLPATAFLDRDVDPERLGRPGVRVPRGAPERSGFGRRGCHGRRQAPRDEGSDECEDDGARADQGYISVGTPAPRPRSGSPTSSPGSA